MACVVTCPAILPTSPPVTEPTNIFFPVEAAIITPLKEPKVVIPSFLFEHPVNARAIIVNEINFLI